MGWSAAGPQGRVIEVAAGTGATFLRYPPAVREVVAVEPEASLRGLATAAAARGPVPVRVIDGVPEQLPAEGSAFDAAVTCTTLCSVRDAPLREFCRGCEGFPAGVSSPARTPSALRSR